MEKGLHSLAVLPTICIKQKKESENCVWSPEEFEKFTSCVNNPTYSLFFTVLYYTGVRLGEA